MQQAIDAITQSFSISEAAWALERLRRLNLGHDCLAAGLRAFRDKRDQTRRADHDRLRTSFDAISASRKSIAAYVGVDS